MGKRIRFKDLSFWLKCAAIAAWFYGSYFIIMFIVGFIQGSAGTA